jgi:predicted transcriptional regulator
VDHLQEDPWSSNRKDLIANTVDVRDEIYKFVNENPGIRYRELLRLLGISNGVLTYHLGILEKSGQIKVERQSNNRVSRYFVASISKQDSDIIGCFRNNVTRNITIYILKNEYCTFNEIADHLGMAPSTVSWHIKRLKEVGILEVTQGSERLLYSVTDKAQVDRVLSKYKETFTEKVIDNYTEMIDGL